MSYDLYLADPVTKEMIKVEHNHFISGGTFAVGGTNQLWLSITYNYGPVFVSVFGEDGVRSIVGKSGAESIPIIQEAIGKLGDDATEIYWDCTEGNAKRALYGLLAFAQMRPDGIWQGD